MRIDFVTSVLNFAGSCVGYKEKTGNSGFQNLAFENLMKQVGHLPGEAWCALFAELCWTAPVYSGKSLYLSQMQNLFSKSAVQTWFNFREDQSGLFITSGRPVPASIAIWQNYKEGHPHWTGHAGVVKEVSEKQFICIEGNSNANGSREGVEVAERERDVNYEKKFRGLVLRGFIKVK